MLAYNFVESNEYLDHLYLKPKSLLPEEFRYGYVSVNNFFNLFHAGFCGPYISNPNYMLLVDFRFVFWNEYIIHLSQL